MRTTTTATALAAVAAVALLAGCGSKTSPSATPTTFDATTINAKAKADAYAGSEKSLRAYYAEMDKYANSELPVRGYASREFRMQINEFAADLKKQGQVVKGSTKLLSVSPEDFVGIPQWVTTMKTCSLSAGGIYDKTGKNVMVDPTGKPISDKPRRVAMEYHLRRVPDDGRWEITDETQVGKC